MIEKRNVSAIDPHLCWELTELRLQYLDLVKIHDIVITVITEEHSRSIIIYLQYFSTLPSSIVQIYSIPVRYCVLTLLTQHKYYTIYAL